MAMSGDIDSPPPIARRLEPDALDEAVELYYLLRAIYREASDLDLAFTICRSYAWDLAASGHLLLHLGLVDGDR